MYVSRLLSAHGTRGRRRPTTGDCYGDGDGGGVTATRREPIDKPLENTARVLRVYTRRRYGVTLKPGETTGEKHLHLCQYVCFSSGQKVFCPWRHDHFLVAHRWVVVVLPIRNLLLLLLWSLFFFFPFTIFFFFYSLHLPPHLDDTTRTRTPKRYKPHFGEGGKKPLHPEEHSHLPHVSSEHG